MITVILLAAGKGTRMQTSTPKVVHLLAGKPLIQHVIETILKINLNINNIKIREICVIYSEQLEEFKKNYNNKNIIFIPQLEALGTAHAVAQALSHINIQDQVLILYADVPLITVEILENFIVNTDQYSIKWLTTILKNPQTFGRIIRNTQNDFIAIREFKDCSKIEQKITEINSGICLIPAKILKDFINKIEKNKLSGEYYLTDLVELLVKNNYPVMAHCLNNQFNQLEGELLLGINNLTELAQAERIYQRRQAEYFMQHGVKFIDPNRFDLRGELSCEADTIFDINIILEGKIKIGKNCKIGANVYLKNSVLHDNVTIHPYSMIENSEIFSQAEIGPFAHIRDHTVIYAHTQIGNFAEIKNSAIGEKTKIKHHSYIGDANIGKQVNIGAGVILCNYDGVKKHKTVIKNNAFIGSNSNLVAPINIGENSYIAAGSTITDSIPDQKLAIARARQVIKNKK